VGLEITVEGVLKASPQKNLHLNLLHPRLNESLFLGNNSLVKRLLHLLNNLLGTNHLKAKLLKVKLEKVLVQKIKELKTRVVRNKASIVM
jgi:hypothetical protein